MAVSQWTDPVLTKNVTEPKTEHMTEVRGSINAIENGTNPPPKAVDSVTVKGKSRQQIELQLWIG
jgi:hypothetical protein